MQTGLEEFRARIRADKKQGRVILIVSAILFAALILTALCVYYVTSATYQHTLYLFTPLQAFKNIYRYIRYVLSAYGIGSVGEDFWSVMSATQAFTTGDCLMQLILTILAGAILAVSGAVYQSAMRNPMAVPTMLGVTSGIELAKEMMIVTFGTEIFSVLGLYYTVSYLSAAAILVVVLLCGKLGGGRHMSVVDMLLAGTLINSLVNTVVNVVWDGMSETNQLLYAELSTRAYSVFSMTKSLLTLVCVCAVVLIPTFCMRFSMNTISFDNEDVRCLGIRPVLMRLYALVAGAILTAAASIHYGDIGVLALIVPHICRYVFGADFRKVLATSAFYGAFVLTIGWFASEFAYIGYYQIPVGSILSFIMLPVILWFSARQRHGWN